MEHKNDRIPIFTERFRELQGDRSNTEFAEFLGISRQTVGFYCNGDRIPDAMTLKQIAEKCKVSADWLLGLSGTRSTDVDIQQICKKTGLSEKAANVLLALGEETQEEYDGISLPLHIDVVNRLVSWPDFIILLKQIMDLKPFNSIIEETAKKSLQILDKIDSFYNYENSSELYDAAASLFFTLINLYNDRRIMRFNTIDTFTDFVDELCDSTNYKKWDEKFNKVEKCNKILNLMDDKVELLIGHKTDNSVLINELQSSLTRLNDFLE